MKNLWLARLARPDIQKAICKLTHDLQEWTRNDDWRLYRLMYFPNSTPHHRLIGRVNDPPELLKLLLFVDADFAGDDKHSKSTSGGYLVLAGPKTWFPLVWLSKTPTSTSRSTTESEVVSLAHSLFTEALPVMDLWDLLLGRPIKLYILEDNQATIKVVLSGYSQKLRHVLRTHKVNLGSVKDVLEKDNAEVMYCNTDFQAADVFTEV